MAEHPRLDARTLLVLSSHPLRNRLLGRLRLAGPATATELARVLETNSGATSYHLRRLEEVGLVEDTGTGQGRARVWRATHDMHSWFPSDLVGAEEGEAALTLLLAEHHRHFASLAERWLAEERHWPTRWRDLAGAGDWYLEIDPDRLQALQDELGEVLERYRTQPSGPGAEGVHVFVHYLPDGDPQ